MRPKTTKKIGQTINLLEVKAYWATLNCPNPSKETQSHSKMTDFQKLFCQVAGDKSDSRRILLSTHGGWIFRMDKVLNRTKKIAKMAQASLNKV